MLFSPRQNLLALAQGSSVTDTDKHNTYLILFLSSSYSGVSFIFSQGAQGRLGRAAWESQSQSLVMQELRWPALDPMSSPRAPVMAHGHQSEFWKIYIDFPQMMMMGYSAVNELIQCFFSIHQDCNQHRNKKKKKKCFVYLFSRSTYSSKFL